MRYIKKGGLGRAGRLQYPPFPFKELLPLQLKDSVSGKSDKQTGVSCIQEIAVMLNCLKDNKFNQKTCSKEIEAFTKCSVAAMAAVKQRRELDRADMIAPGVNRLTTKQLNKLLKEHRQPK